MAACQRAHTIPLSDDRPEPTHAGSFEIVRGPRRSRGQPHRDDSAPAEPSPVAGPAAPNEGGGATTAPAATPAVDEQAASSNTAEASPPSSGSHLMSPASPDDPGQESDEEGFVVVAKPVMTIRQFTDWLQQTRLPNAHAVMQGKMEEEDTIQILVSRKSFLRDLLKSFKGTLSSDGAVAHDAWPRLWDQFLRDLPREEVHIGGEPLVGPGDSLDDRTIVEDKILPAIRRFVTKRIPPEMLDIDQWQQRNASVAAVRRAADSPTQRAATNWLNPFSVLSLAASAAASAAVKTATFAAASLSPRAGPTVGVSPPSPARSDDASTDEFNPDRLPATPKTPEDVIDGYTRLVILMCQQSVLAFPLEIINAQFCDDIEGALYVGEVAKADPRHHSSGMRIHITPTPGRDTGAQLQVAKVFRVFSIAESVDYNLFYVDVRVDVDLFASEDLVSFTWRIIPAASPIHRIVPDVSAGLNGQQRHCGCLGASSGYHKKGCCRKFAS